MKRKYGFVAFMLTVILLVSMGLTAGYIRKEDAGGISKMKIVTSFYPMYVITANLIDGVSGVELENLSEPQTGCLHDYQLTPFDMKMLSGADLFIVNGGGIESFLADTAANYPELHIITACEGMELLQETEAEEVHTQGEESGDGHLHEEDNAHAWMSVSRYMEMVDTVARGLAAADEKQAEIYLENAASYRQKLQPLADEFEELREETEGNSVILFHEAYAYVAEDLGLNTAYLLNLDEERQVSAKEVADVAQAVLEDKTKVVLAEEIYGKDMGDTICRESDAAVIYLDTLTRGDYGKDSYLEGMQENIRLLKEAFAR